MIIRQQQMASLSELSRRQFAQRVAEHLIRCFPAACEALGQERMQAIIDDGIERARSYGIDRERDVCKYIDLIFVFGRDFDTNPEFPWACRTLADDTLVDSTIKTERLFAAAKRWQMQRSHEYPQ